MIIATTPIREKINAIASDAPYLRQVARHGAIKARESASKTIKEIREIIGFRSF
jgi:tryptophanyl-tRNA synthetase